MYPTSEIAYRLFTGGGLQKARITVFQKDGTVYKLTDADICTGGLSVDRYSVTGQKIEIGSAVAAELSLRLRNDGKLNDRNFQGAELFVEVGVVDSVTPRILQEENGFSLLTEKEETEESLEVEVYNTLPEDTAYTTIYVPLGWFQVDNTPRTLSTISVTALDRMICFDKYAQKSDLSFPCTVSELLLQICRVCGVNLAENSVAQLTNADYEITSYPEQEDLTYRTMLMWIAQITGTCAYLDWDGRLRLEWYGDGGTISIDESVRYSSDLQEQFITVTGIVIKTDDTAYHRGTYPYDYMLSIDGNLLIQGDGKNLADALGRKFIGFTYIPFEAKTLAMPFLFPMDKVNFLKAGVTYNTILTNVNYTLNGSTNLAAKGESKESNALPKLSPFTPSQAQENRKKEVAVEEKLSAQANATQHLNQTAASAMGMYYSERTDENGGVIRYWHDNESLENSLYICMQNAGGSFSTNTGWNNGNPQWTAGTDKFGNAVVSLLNTIGIQAEWIRADSITTDKLSIGQSERGTNLIEDSSFEHGGVFVRATYSGEDEDAQVQSPAHNDRWNAVSFRDTDTYDIEYRGYLETPDIGGFDGNKAVIDVNLKGLSENETEWFYGYEQIQSIPIDMLTHIVSFYYRVRRYPLGTTQGTETAHAKYAFKIQWLNQNGEEISCTFYSFSVQSGNDDVWHRLYTTVTPPNDAKSARFAIGFICTDKCIFSDGGETGELGYPDLAFCDLDGILFEPGTVLDTWTCSAAEVRNTGVIINSNGVNIADGKISVTDIFGRKVLYTDGNNGLQLTGGLTAQMYDQSTGRLYAQTQILPSVNKSPYSDSSGAFENSFLGQTFTKIDENGLAENVGHIGIPFTEYEGVGNNNPMQFYSKNGFHFDSESSFLFNGMHPLVCDPKEISENTDYISRIQTPGWYICPTDERAKKLQHTPVDRAFIMQVSCLGSYVTQYFVSRLGETYQRTFDAAAEKIYGNNWAAVTNYGIIRPQTQYADNINPGTYIVAAEDIKYTQDEIFYSSSYPVNKRGILECMRTVDGDIYQRYSTWDGYVYMRNSYFAGNKREWTYWRCNGVAPGI